MSNLFTQTNIKTGFLMSNLESIESVCEDYGLHRTLMEIHEGLVNHDAWSEPLDVGE